MSPRRLTALALGALVLGLSGTATAAAADSSGPGFRMPSRLVTCGVLTINGAEGLYCSAPYITRGAYDGLGVVKLRPGARARVVPSGNDILLLIGGYDFPEGATQARRWPRPVLAYGTTWRKRGYVCRSRTAGLTCRRGNHGFFLSRERQRLF